MFQEKFIEKRCILGRGRAVFQVFIAKAYREFCGDCEADCRAPTNQEIAEAERDAFQRGDRFYRYPERIPAVAVDHGLWLTESELSNAVLALTDVQASQGTNVHGTKDAIYEGLSLRDAFRYENCEPVSQMAPGRLVIT